MEQTDIIVFRAYDNKHQQPVLVGPLQDRSGKLWTGQGDTGYFEGLTDERKRTMGHIINHFTRVTITDGKVLDLRDPVDAANWAWIQKHPYIALDKEKGKASRDAVYYVENKRKEADARVSTAKLKDKARYVIQYELSLERLRYVAKALGQLAADSFTENEVKDWLLQIAENTPDAVLFHTDAKNQQETDANIKFVELERYRVIAKHKGSIYRFGGEEGVFLGRTQDQVIAFLKDGKNIETVAALDAELEARKAKSEV